MSEPSVLFAVTATASRMTRFAREDAWQTLLCAAGRERLEATR